MKGRPAVRSHKAHTAFDVYNFLEKDVQRLEKLDYFISIRLANWIKFSQTPTLLAQQKQLRQSKEEALLKQNLNLASPLHRNFAALWNKVTDTLAAAQANGEDQTLTTLSIPPKDNS